MKKKQNNFQKVTRKCLVFLNVHYVLDMDVFCLPRLFFRHFEATDKIEDLEKTPKKKLVACYRNENKKCPSTGAIHREKN